MILTREQFVAWWNQWVPENPALKRDHPLWIPETEIKPGLPSQWFIKNYFDSDTEGYWAWCDANLKGIIRCYMLDENEGWEWWGFTNKEDMVVWMLKWM